MKGSLVYLFIVLISISSSFRIPKEDANHWRTESKNDIETTIKRVVNLEKAKNVILFIGDGMGINTVTPARIYKGQKAGESGEEGLLSWESFPSTGFSKTYNTDYQVPDSAGTATAILSGSKTSMSLLGLDNTVSFNVCDPSVLERGKLSNIFHWALEEGKETGIVTTTRITHATPAAVYAHSPNRDWENDGSIPGPYQGLCDDIAKQLIYGYPGNQLKVILGGGLQHFKMEKDGKGLRKDEDLIQFWKKEKKNTTSAFVSNKRELMNVSLDSTEYIFGLFNWSHISYETERDTETEPSLSEMTIAAIKRLERSKSGFVLLVEGGRIDHAHHKNYAKRAFEEVLEMDKAVSRALDLVNIDNTLIVVTADHSHAVTMNGYPVRGHDILGYIYDEERTKGFKTMSDGSLHGYSTISYANGPGYYDHFKNEKWLDVRNFNFNAIDYRQPSLWPGPEDYETHGGEDVPIYAIGPMSTLFTGVHEQSYIGNAIGYAACIGMNKAHCTSKTAKKKQRDYLSSSSSAYSYSFKSPLEFFQCFLLNLLFSSIYHYISILL